MNKLTRRRALKIAGASVVLSAGMHRPIHAAGKTVKIGIDLPLTGGDAETADLMKASFMMAINDINARGGAGGYMLEAVVMDDSTATAGGYDPAQAATNARRMINDPEVIAALGPANSGAGKAMSPILSAASLPIITANATNPDITDPKLAQIYRPAGPAVFFRTVTTDAYQAPNLANYFAETLKAKTIFIVDDSGAYGVGFADAFEKQARAKGLQIVSRDRIDPKAADYSAIMTKIKQMNPDALFYGGNVQGGVKVVKQSYEAVPKMIKGSGDGLFEPEILSTAGFPAAEGWYVTSAAAHLLDEPDTQKWVERFAATYHNQPNDYCILGYDAGLVIADALDRITKSGKPLSRQAMRDAIQATNLQTMQGLVSFDENGDIASHVISVFQISHDASHPANDMVHQFKYVGVAPAT